MTTEEAMKQVEAGLEALSESLKAGKSETLQKFIETMARFHKYSFQNALLIFAQMQDATHVAGFGTWKKLDRFVKKGERGIAIIAPLVAGKNTCRFSDTGIDGLYHRSPAADLLRRNAEQPCCGKIWPWHIVHFCLELRSMARHRTARAARH